MSEEDVKPGSRRRTSPAPKEPVKERSLLDGVNVSEIEDTTTKVEIPTYRKGALVEPLMKVYVMVGTMLMPFDQHCSATIIQQSEAMAKSMDELARTNPQVRKVLMKMVQGSAWGMVIAAHAPVLMAVAVHHVPQVRDRMAAMGLADAEKFVKEQEG